MPETHHIVAALGAVTVVAVASRRKPTAPDPAGDKPGKRKRYRITTSTTDQHKTVIESPRQLLAQARKRVGADISLDELTAARLIASELSRGSPQEMAAMVDAELNRAEAKGKTLTAHLTSAGTYGKQGGRHQGGKKRLASTRRDPTRAHLRIARAVLDGQLRGIALGAVRFFDPVSQWAAHKKWLTGQSERRHCHPAIIIERWTHDKDWDRRGPECALRLEAGRHLQEWVGPVDGINPMRVMLLRPAKAGEEHQRRYREARRLILERYPLPSTRR